MKASEVKTVFPTEADLCEVFIEDVKAVGGWTVYPETAGFDILCVYDKTGHQLGIEAKLALNAKVVDQILPGVSGYQLSGPGPDFRAVLVPSVTDANAGIAEMLRIVGVIIFKPLWAHRRGARSGAYRRSDDYRHPTFIDVFQNNGWPHRPYDSDSGATGDYGDPAWFDWNPERRCELPEIVPTVAAGVPAPTRLTQWKIGALRVLAELEIEGFITAAGVRAHGIDARRFCSADGWLEQLGNGRWGRGRIPAFDQQHPEAYAEVLAQARAKREAAA